VNSIQRKIDQVLIAGIVIASALTLASVEFLIVRERKARHENLAMTSAKALVQSLGNTQPITRNEIAAKLDDLSNVRVIVWVTGKDIEPILPTNSVSNELLEPNLLKKANYKSVNPSMPEYFNHNNITYFTCSMELPPTIKVPAATLPMTIRFMEDTTRTPLNSWQTSAQILAIILGVSGIALLAMRGSLSQALKPINRLEQSMKSVDIEAMEIDQENAKILLTTYPLELHGLISEYNRLLSRISAQQKNTKFFISAVSHELRTPFLIILGYVQKIRKQITTNTEAAKSKKSLASLGSATQDALLTLENLISLARADSRSLKIHIEQFSAYQFLQRLSEENEVKTGTNQALPYINLIRCEEAWLESDKSILRNSINSVLENANKYAPDPRGVEIYGYPSENGLSYIIDIRDFGDGVPPEIRETIFDRFIRGNNGRRKTVGSGLGLAVVKETLSLVSSSIQAPENIYGQGALFRISIPLSNPAPETEGA